MTSFVSHKLKLIFCHIPRTGGTSFFEAIKPFLGENDDIQSIEKHTPLIKLKMGRIGDVFDEYLKVTIVRNENQRRESLVRHTPPSMSFDADYWFNTTQWICDEKGKCLADVKIQFKGLPGSALLFLRHNLKLDVKEFPHLNKDEP